MSAFCSLFDLTSGQILIEIHHGSGCVCLLYARYAMSLSPVRRLSSLTAGKRMEVTVGTFMLEKRMEHAPISLLSYSKIAMVNQSRYVAIRAMQNAGLTSVCGGDS